MYVKEKKYRAYSEKFLVIQEGAARSKTSKQPSEASKKNKDLINTLKTISLVVYNNEDWKRNALFILIASVAATVYASGKLTIFSPVIDYLVFFLVFAGVLYSMVILSFVMKKRKRFDSDFITFIDLFSSHCNAGKSITHSLEQSVCSLKNNILVSDFSKIIFLLSSGVSLQQSLVVSQTTKRFPYLYYNLFFTMLTVSIDKGGELSKNIAWLKEQIVKKKKIEDKINTLTAEAKMSRNILVALPVAFLGITFFFNKPNFIWLISTHAGRIVMCISWGLIGLGITVSSLIVSTATKV